MEILLRRLHHAIMLQQNKNDYNLDNCIEILGCLNDDIKELCKRAEENGAENDNEFCKWVLNNFKDKIVNDNDLLQYRELHLMGDNKSVQEH